MSNKQTRVEKLKALDMKIVQHERRAEKLRRELSAAKRKARTHRLIQHGLIADSLIPGADEMDGEQFKAALQNMLSGGQDTVAAEEE